jgi:hypothetical protein
VRHVMPEYRIDARDDETITLLGKIIRFRIALLMLCLPWLLVWLLAWSFGMLDAVITVAVYAWVIALAVWLAYLGCMFVWSVTSPDPEPSPALLLIGTMISYGCIVMMFGVTLPVFAVFTAMLWLPKPSKPFLR